MNRFEQLIEYVINDEDQKARELFHDIVVAKSREIYENLMQEEAEEELDEAAEEELDEEEEIEEGAMGGDASDDLIDEIETEESSDISMEGEDDADAEFDDEAEEAGDELTGDLEMDHDEAGEEDHATKDDIMNLEDKLDQLMAEFEAAMGGDDMGSNGDGFGPEEGGDAIEMDDTEEMGMMEAVSLKAAPKPVTAEQGDGKAGPVAFNSGQTGMAGSPVKPTGTEAKGRPAPTTKELIGDFQNKAGGNMKDPSAATKPHLAQASGVNTKSPLPGRKG
jgi:hypothetical protein